MDQTAQVLLLLNALFALIVPLITQALSHSNAPEQVKAVLNLGIAAVVGVATPFLTGDQSISNIDWKIVGLSVAQVWVGSIVAHYGLFKPSGVTGVGGLIDSLTKGIGVGSGSSTPTSNTTGVGNDTVPPEGAQIADTPGDSAAGEVPASSTDPATGA